MRLSKKGLENFNFQKKVLIISLIVLSIFLVGCGTVLDYLLDATDEEPTSPNLVDTNSEQPETTDSTNTDEDTTSDVVEGEIKKTTTKNKEGEEGCQQNSDCPAGYACIDNECSTVADLYVTEGCTEKCNYNSIVLETSDKQTFTLNRGKGDYTAAGAIEWKLVSGPDYCPGDDIIVPVNIERKYLGEIVNEEIITVKVGEKSSVITHPNMKSIKFTFTVKSVNEECS